MNQKRRGLENRIGRSDNLVAALALMLTLSWHGFAKAAESPPLAGGYTKVALNEPDVISAARAALPHITRKHSQLRRVVSVERQVVAGLNYRLILLLNDGSRWRATVWQKLDRSYEVKIVTRVGT